MEAYLLQQSSHKLPYIFAFSSYFLTLNFISVQFLDYPHISLATKFSYTTGPWRTAACPNGQTRKVWCTPAGEFSLKTAVSRKAQVRCFTVILILLFKLQFHLAKHCFLLIIYGNLLILLLKSLLILVWILKKKKRKTKQHMDISFSFISTPISETTSLFPIIKLILSPGDEGSLTMLGHK